MVPAVAGPRSDRDVAEQVGGDDDVEAVGVEHHLDRQAVDVVAGRP